MTSLASDEQILKTDIMGRVRTPRARREALLDEFERSGMCGVQFAGLAGVKYQTFAAWVNQRRKQVAARSTPAEDAVGGGRPVRWVEAIWESPAGAAAGGGPALQVYLPGGAWVEVGDPRQAVLAAELLRALGSCAGGKAHA